MCITERKYTTDKINNIAFVEKPRSVKINRSLKNMSSVITKDLVI